MTRADAVGASHSTMGSGTARLRGHRSTHAPQANQTSGACNERRENEPERWPSNEKNSMPEVRIDMRQRNTFAGPLRSPKRKKRRDGERGQQ